MPRPGRVCAQPGCPLPAPGGGYCPEHRAAIVTARSRRRPSSRDRGYTRQWERTRARTLAHRPHCERCGQPATTVHHLDGQGPRGPRGHDPANLEALCARCHGIETNRAGGTRG